MSIVKPFYAVRPKKEYASRVAELPYDVMSSEEARECAAGNSISFLHVDKAEIDLPAEVDLYDDRVYRKAAENLKKLSDDGICVKEEKPCLYIYRQIMNGRAQTGIVGCASVEDYRNGVIKRHEMTRADKEVDRIRHVEACNANTGPIFLTYRRNEAVSAVSARYADREPEYDFISAGGIRQTVWVVSDDGDIDAICGAFQNVDSLYIADGHHRAASAVHIGTERRKANPDSSGTEEFNFFLAVFFPGSDLAIMDYNRVIKDTNGLTDAEFIGRISGAFTVESAPQTPYHPERAHTFGMFLGGKWYKLTAKEGSFDASDTVKSLDVSILQDNLIAPVLGITDPRKDKRIDFVGGIRGLKELECRASSDMKLAFAMYPTTVDELMAIADAGQIMPPKSTWFEPKLLSGLFIHELD